AGNADPAGHHRVDDGVEQLLARAVLAAYYAVENAEHGGACGRQPRGNDTDRYGAAKLAYQQIAFLAVDDLAHRPQGAGIAPVECAAIEVEVDGLDTQGLDTVVAVVAAAQIAHQGAVLARRRGDHRVEQRIIAVVALEQMDDGGLPLVDQLGGRDL